MADKRIYEFEADDMAYYVADEKPGRALRRLVERIGGEIDDVVVIKEYKPGATCRFHDMSTDQTVDVWKLMEDDEDAVLRVWKDVQVS